MKKKRVLILRFALCGLLAAFLLLSPPHLARSVGLDRYHAFFEKTKPEWYGKIVLWHIVEWKPYQGSATKLLRERADAFCASRPGVHFEVIGMSADKARERLARGETPDAYSFPSGFLYCERLRPMEGDVPPLTAGLRPAASEGVLYALPYMQSCYVLLMNTQLLSEAGLDTSTAYTADFLQRVLDTKAKVPQLAMPEILAAEMELTGALAAQEDFAAGKVMLSVGDLRAYGNLQRSEDKNLLTEAIPATGFCPLVQYIGAAKDTDDVRAALIAEFAQTLLTPDEQRRLPAIGALPAARDCEDTAYADPVLRKCLEALPAQYAPDPFLYERHAEALCADALRALSGETAAQDAFFERLHVVLDG